MGGEHDDGVRPLSGRNELVHLERRLMERFCPPLRPDEVDRCLAECTARFEGARVRAYLSVLIERAANERLRTAVRESELRPETESLPRSA